MLSLFNIERIGIEHKHGLLIIISRIIGSGARSTVIICESRKVVIGELILIRRVHPCLELPPQVNFACCESNSVSCIGILNDTLTLTTGPYD